MGFKKVLVNETVREEVILLVVGAVAVTYSELLLFVSILLLIKTANVHYLFVR